MSDNGSENQADAVVAAPRRAEPTPPAPPGMSKSAWKRELKRQRWEAQKGEFTLKRKEKRKEQKLERKRKAQEEGVEVAPKKTKTMGRHEKVPITVIIDCGFDEMMKERERTSLATQVMRCYSENRKAAKSVNLQITSFNKSLKERFEGPMRNQYLKWKDVEFRETDFEVPADEDTRKRWLYLSSDSSNTLETLDENMTYIIGGIVDKGRYKNLCQNKASEQHIATARLPIDEFIKISGRRVLTTNHVFEIILKWLELRDWKTTFEAVLPPKKLADKHSNKERQGAEESDEEDSRGTEYTDDEVVDENEQG
jgi:tRNA (guanine9-N1)-methyltransferase